MARWAASAKWGEAPALDGQCATLLGLALSEGLGHTLRCQRPGVKVDLPPLLTSFSFDRGDDCCHATSGDAFRALRGSKN